MRRLAILLLVTMLVGLVGCYKDTIIVDPKYDARATRPTGTVTHVAIFGIINIGADVDLKRECPRGGGGFIRRSTLFSLGWIPGLAWIDPLHISSTEIFCRVSKQQ